MAEFGNGHGNRLHTIKDVISILGMAAHHAIAQGEEEIFHRIGPEIMCTLGNNLLTSRELDQKLCAPLVIIC